MHKNILICGDRNWVDEGIIKLVISNYVNMYPEIKYILIHGGCRGADLIAAKIAQEFGWEIKEFKADWKTYGKAAGPIRNLLMIKEGKPDTIIGFHANIKNSKGTKNMLGLAKKHNIEFVLHERTLAEINS